MLSSREKEVLQLHSIGLTPDEIGDNLFISKETVRKTISNIKAKLQLQKATEIAAYYWCEFFGTSLEEQRKQILATLFVSSSFSTSHLILILLINDDFAFELAEKILNQQKAIYQHN